MVPFPGLSRVLVRRSDAILLATFVVLVQVALWSANLPWLRALAVAGVAVMAISGAARTLAQRRRAVAAPGMLGAWCCSGAITLVGCLALGGVAIGLGATNECSLIHVWDKPPQHWLSIKLPTVAAQQVMLHWFIVPMLARLLVRGPAVIVSGAILFSLFHLPNPLLMLLTLLASAVWIQLYLAFGRLGPLVVSHFVLAIVVAGTCGEYVLNMRVGASCLELFPRRITTDEDSIVLLPHAVVGEVDRAIQAGNEVLIDGWSIDQIHQRVADRLLIRVGNRSTVVDLAPVRRQRPQVAQQYDSPTCHQCGFQVRLPVDWFGGNPTVDFYAANCNGWFAQLNCWGKFTLEAHPPPVEIAIFPRSVQGRVRQLVRRDQQLELVGWAADRQNRFLPETLLVEIGQRRLQLPLHNCRRTRADLAEAFGESWISQSGFAVVLPARAFASTHAVHGAPLRVFGMGKNGTYSPLDCRPIQAQLSSQSSPFLLR